MNSKNLLTLAITLTLGVILAGSLLMPVISDAQKDLGNPITKSNQIYNGFYVEPNAEYTLELDKTGWTANGVDLTGQNFRQLVFSDSFTIMIDQPMESGAFGYISGKEVANPIYFNALYAYEVTFADNTVNVVRTTDDTTIFTKTYTWAFAACAEGTAGAWGTIVRVGTTDAYVLDESQLILSGYYYTGDNDTFYSYRDGVLYCGEYSGSVEITKGITNGTTDIFNITELDVNVGDETFTPFLALVPLSVTGHATAGAAYSLLGALPIMVIIGLVFAATAAIVAKRDD